MTEDTVLPFSVTLTLSRNGHVLREFVAETRDDLACAIEMDTGTGWLDAAELYQRMANKKRDHLSETFNVCHSYEKWGGMQQEVVKIRVKLQRVPDVPLRSADVQVSGGELIDERGEWYSEYSGAGYIYKPPGWYRLGMIASALWLVIYLLVYPSIPLLYLHW
jgi:hypothetical protein